MFRFYRNLRKNLLEEGKSRKYLKYAIGEIVLVVIGILIALQINNWNEARKDRDKEQLVLRQLQEDYGANLLQLNEKMAMRDQIIRSSIKILEYIDHPDVVGIDSLSTYLSPLVMDPTFDPIQNDLIVSGTIRLLQNEQLKSLLTRWTSEVVQLTETEMQWQKVRSEVYIPFTIKTGIARDAINVFWKDQNVPIFILDQEEKNVFHIGKSKLTPDPAVLLGNPELEGLVTTAFTLNHVCNLQSNVLKERIEEILSILKSEIH